MYHGQRLVFSSALLCVPGSVGSDHNGKYAGDTGTVQRCMRALED